MKKNLLKLAFLTLPLLGFGQTFQEDFDGNGPGLSAWTIIDVDGRTPATDIAAQGFTGAWISKDRGGPTPNYGGPDGNFAAMSTSWYSPAGASNDWLISPQIVLPSAASVLKWDAKAQDADYPDGYKIMLSTNGGNTVADFTVQLYSTTGEESEWITREQSLAAYAGQTVRIAFVNNSNDMFVLLIDNIKVENAPTTVPNCPAISAPANGATNVVSTSPVTLTWTSTPTATSYDVYLDTNANPTTLLGNYTTTTTSSTLLVSTTYYWKVVAKNGAGDSTGCTIYSFTTGANPASPYCGPLTFTGLFGDNIEPISLVNFAGINNATDAALDNSPAHEFFLDKVANVTQGSSYPLTLKGNTGGDYISNFAVFIDWNQNGTFESNETYLPPSIANSTGTDEVQSVSDIAVPATALVGTTRMRVKKNWDIDSANLLNPCLGASYGQAEDYTVTVGSLAVTETSKNNIKYYPNPVKDIFNIEAQGKIRSVKVFDIAGKQLLTKDLNEAKSQIDFSKFNAGVYVVTTLLEDGTSTSTKVIKK